MDEDGEWEATACEILVLKTPKTYPQNALIKSACSLSSFIVPQVRDNTS
jgi:hypothetical protein